MKFLIIAVTVLFVLTQCKSTEYSVDNNTSVKIVDSDIEVQDQKPAIILEGHWTLIKTDIIEEKQSIERFVEVTEPHKVREWSPPVYINNDGALSPHSKSYYLSKTIKDLVFSGDSIYGMDYPLELLQKHSYTIESDLLQIGNDPIKKSIALSSDKDTLRFSYLDSYGLYLEETYVKTTFDKSILNILKLYITNFPLLAGEWRLVREGGGYDGYDAYDITYPFDIPDTIVMTKEELESTLYTDRSYSMLTSGNKQKYFLKYYNSVLWLIPGDWYKGIDPSIHFERIKEEDY